MSVRKIRENNEQGFIDDFKRVNDIMVFAPSTRGFFKIRKSEVWEQAQRDEVLYYLTDKIFRNGRTVMVIK